MAPENAVSRGRVDVRDSARASTGFRGVVTVGFRLDARGRVSGAVTLHQAERDGSAREVAEFPIDRRDPADVAEIVCEALSGEAPTERPT